MSEQNRAAAGPRLDRRAALARLGLAATAAYIAPALLTLSGARASSGSSWSGGHRHGFSCGSSGSSGFCGSRPRHRRRNRFDHHHHVYVEPPLPPRRPYGIYGEVFIPLPEVEVIVRP